MLYCQDVKKMQKLCNIQLVMTLVTSIDLILISRFIICENVLLLDLIVSPYATRPFYSANETICYECFLLWNTCTQKNLTPLSFGNRKKHQTIPNPTICKTEQGMKDFHEQSCVTVFSLMCDNCDNKTQPSVKSTLFFVC